MARIVIVERSESIRGLMAGYLKQCDFEVVEAEHGLEAAAKMRAAPPDLLLIDQDVRMGGLKTARLLRLHPAYQQIPIILSVNHRETGLELVEQGKRLNLDAFIVKPCAGKELETRIRKSLRKRLGRISVNDVRAEIGRLAELPVLLENHRKMLGLLAKEDDEVAIPELIRTVETDQGLTTRILRISHSAYYGFRGNTIESAITFLGIDKIRRIVQSAIIFDLFETDGKREGEDGFSALELWKHSVGCGVVMERGGHRVKGRDHFIAGMLHDIGKVILHMRFREYFEEALRIAREEEKSLYQAERELIGISHTDVGHELAKKWELPPTIATGIAFHHNPSAALQHKRLAALVHLSDILVRVLEIGHGGDRKAIAMDEAARPLAKYVFEAGRQKGEIVAEVASVVGEERADLQREEVAA